MYILYTQGMQVTLKGSKISELGCVWYLVFEWTNKRILFTKMSANVEIFYGAARL